MRLLTFAWQDLKKAGAQQNAEGKGQEAQGQLNDFGSGIANRVSGAVQGGVAGLTGDREAQLAAQEKHDIGKSKFSILSRHTAVHYFINTHTNFLQLNNEALRLISRSKTLETIGSRKMMIRY